MTDINFSDNRLFFSNYDNFDDWYINANTNGFGINVLYLNIRSIRKNWDTLMLQLATSNVIFDIIILAEVSCEESELALYNLLPEYRLISKLRENKKGGGLIMFINNNTLSYTHISLEGNIDTYESITGELELTRSNYRFVIHAVYRPPTSSTGFPPQLAINELNAALSSLTRHQNLIFLGDYNLNIKDQCDINVIQYEAVLAQWGLDRGIFDYTREEVRVGILVKSCIDHIYYRLDRPIESIYTGIIKTKISDHYPVVARLELQGEDTRNVMVENITRINKRSLSERLKSEKWGLGLLEHQNVNRGFEELIEKFVAIYDQCTVVIKKSAMDRTYRSNIYTRLPVKEWMSHRLLRLMRERDRVFRLWKGDPSNVRHRNLYKKLRNRLNNELKARKNNYYRLIFENNKYDAKKVWENVNCLLGRGSKSSIDKSILLAMGKSMSESEIVNGFADFFIEGVESLKHNCRFMVTGISPLRNIKPLHNLLIPKATPFKILSIIKNMNANKSPGIDMIKIQDIKSIADNIVEPLTVLINMSISQGIFPECLKKAIVRPIHKNKSKKEFHNYRPIAILPSIEKILEKYVGDCLVKYLEENHLLSDRQFGFRKRRNTGQALEEFANVANDIMDNRRHGLGLFIDFSKAFDTIEHKQMIDAMHRLGVRGPYLSWFSSYLKDRKFIVKVGNSASEEKSPRYGVPQGSKIGPILFLIYLNEILDKLENCHIFAFADDVLLLSDHKDIRIAEGNLQRDFTLFTDWAHNNGLIINLQKTCLMHICPKNMKCEREISISCHSCDCLHGFVQCHCKKIGLVEKTKYLGLTVDNRLTWKEHVTSLHRKLRSCTALMYRLQNRLPDAVKLSVYKALFESNLRYGVSIWGTAADSHLQLLSGLQKRCLRILYGSDLGLDLIDVSQRYSILGHLTPKGLYILILILKYFNSNEFKIAYRRNFNTRNIIKYIVPTPRTSYGERLPDYIVPHVYNRLPDYIEQIGSFSEFKNSVFLWLISLEQLIV